MIDLVALDNGSPSGVGAVIDVFDAANQLLRADRFAVRCLGLTNPVRLRGGLSLATTSLSDAEPAPWVIVPGLGAATVIEMEARLRRPDIAEVAAWLRKARGTVVGGCTAAFVLGEAGKLDGRECTTTWWLAGLLARRYPKATVDADRMIVRDQASWTGGAAFSQIDLALAIVEEHDDTLAKEVASRLAFERRRSQADFASDFAETAPEVAAIEQFTRTNLTEPITLGRLAAHVGTSPRTLTRWTTAATGKSPMQIVQHVRLQVALDMLRTTRESTQRIAHAVGLADTASLYRLVKQATGRTPSQFRFTA